MNSKKLIYLVVFAMAFLSLLFVRDIYGYFTKVTDPLVNQLSIERNTSYTVVHEVMDLNGDYVELEDYRETVTDIPIGTTVIPDVLGDEVVPREGFYIPELQSVTLNSFDNTVITYRYIRKEFTLTINDSNYVTTDTPSGTYYYGQEIHLIADEEDDLGLPFKKWSNNETNPDYTFVLTQDTTIGPLYTDSYTITYVPNNGDNPFDELVIEGEPITEFPDVEYNDCVGTTGDYVTRQCTEVYHFLGWYKEANFVNKVDETFVPTEDITLYAKWNKVYFREDGPVVFDGDDIINTGVKLFNAENARKDFIVTFTVDSYTGYNPTNNKDKRATIFTNMYEVKDPYYGTQFFRDDTGYAVNINASNDENDRMKDYDTGYVTGQNVILKRENGVVYYSYDDGTTFIPTMDFSSFTAYFNEAATFGGGLDSGGNPFRFLIGTLSNMSVEIIEPPSYTIHYDQNGGTGVMPDQVVEIGTTPSLSTNRYTKEDYLFNGWNTAANGTGTSYPNNYTITSDLGNDGDVITLYAQWVQVPSYYVHFDANGGTGTMSDQKLYVDQPAEPLTANTFTRANYVFKGWNTEPDGTGTHYDDEETVRNLSTTTNDVVTLYADWWKIAFNRSGDVTFNCTASTFIDTGVNVFSTENINKDFEIRFTFKDVANDQYACAGKQPTIFNVKDESNSAMPGFNLRFNQEKDPVDTMTATGKWAGSGSSSNITSINVSRAPVEIVYKRTNKVITMQYFYNNTQSTVFTVINQNNWTLNQPFATNVAFGGYYNSSNQPGRFFKGTLADLSILIDE